MIIPMKQEQDAIAMRYSQNQKAFWGIKTVTVETETSEEPLRPGGRQGPSSLLCSSKRKNVRFLLHFKKEPER